ncbi:hypothetical protein ABZ569_02820 [Streptomyces albus]|uniref:hypothetical protein n=1 Tax=Streptomyces albus TaxID=1888 RepID=UPI0033D0538C
MPPVPTSSRPAPSSVLLTVVIRCGTGAGLVAPDLNLLLSEIAPDGRHGRVLSGLVTAVFLGQFLSPLALRRLDRGTGLAAAFTWTGGAPTAGAARPWPVSPPV